MQDLYKKDFSSEQIATLKQNISTCARLYTTRLGACDFPNSGHALAMHVSYYLDLYGSLAPFSQQGFEHLMREHK